MNVRGVLPVVQVPYRDDGDFDLETLQAEIDWLFSCGVNGLTIGMVSEVLRLTDAERDRLAAECVRLAAGRGPVIASCGAESVAQAVRHARAAQDAGASALMAIPPSLTRCPPDEISRYYEALLDATRLPLVVQDASGYVGNSIPIPTQAALFRRCPERVMFKPEAQPLGPCLSALRDATGGQAPIFEGTGGLILPDAHRRGVVGTMPGAEIPWVFVALWRALENGEEEKARELHAPVAVLVSMLTSLDAFLAVEKLLLVKQGIFKNARVRGPVAYRLDPESEQEVLRIFARLKELCGRK